ncbi:UNVERIFIED_CONTAM: hypothetical protein K2H54_019784 [Gekko kuhli]
MFLMSCRTNVSIPSVVFIAGNRLYKKTPPQGNILLEVCKCISFALTNRIKNRSQEIPKRKHWLDWASEKYSNQLITEVKMVTRVLFLFIPLPMFWALFDQQGSRWTLQATKMNGDFFLNPLLILILIPVFDLGFYPLVNLCKLNFTPIKKMATGMILAGLAFAVAAFVELKIEDNAIPDPVARKSHIQVLNLADSNIEVAVLHPDLFQLSSEPFQDPDDYSKLILTGAQQSLPFRIQYQGSSFTFNHTVQEKFLYSLIVYKAEGNLTSYLIKDMGEKPSEGMAAIRFINTLAQDVNITLGKEEFVRSYSASDYRIVERGRYNNVKCQTEAEEYVLHLGLLDFGASYTVVITRNNSENLLEARKIEDIPANDIHMAWQIPQYLLISAGEVMFSVTGLSFSYSQGVLTGGHTMGKGSVCLGPIQVGSRIRTSETIFLEPVNLIGSGIKALFLTTIHTISSNGSDIQAPASMKSVLQAGWLLTVAFGNVIVLIVAQVAPLKQTIAVVAVTLHWNSIVLYPYIDDWLVVTPSISQLLVGVPFGPICEFEEVLSEIDSNLTVYRGTPR